LEPDQLEAGCDEAGRGCLAGPVVAAAVILPPDYKSKQLNDSKKLSARIREILRNEIEKEAISFSVAFIDNQDIDKLNILKASIMAMHKAIRQLDHIPHHLLIDGNKFFAYKNIPHTCIVKGDGKYMAIAAASILAKTYRDAYMFKLHRNYTDYGWDRNKGYPTKQHREAIVRNGLTPYHRRSFQQVNAQMEINFEKV
jgi:ribonuclease HII